LFSDMEELTSDILKFVLNDGKDGSVLNNLKAAQKCWRKKNVSDPYNNLRDQCGDIINWLQDDWKDWKSKRQDVMNNFTKHRFYNEPTSEYRAIRNLFLDLKSKFVGIREVY